MQYFTYTVNQIDQITNKKNRLNLLQNDVTVEV